MDIDACIARLTGKDAKDAYALPITARQCIAALSEIAEIKPEFIPRIRSALQQADLSGYPDSMQPLVLKDIVAVLQKIDGGK